jgi:hypothetical protein
MVEDAQRCAQPGLSCCSGWSFPEVSDAKVLVGLTSAFFVTSGLFGVPIGEKETRPCRLYLRPI